MPWALSVFGPATGHMAIDAKVRIRDLSAWLDIASGGTIGAGEAYMAGKLTQQRPARCHASAGRQSRGDERTGIRHGTCRQRAAAPRPLAPPQYTHRQPAQHPRPLRPRRRTVQPVSRSVDDVLGSGLSARRGNARRSLAAQARSDLPQARTAARRSAAGNRHRLGRPRHSCRTPLRLPGHDHHHLGQPVRLCTAAAYRQRDSPIASLY